MSTDPAGTLNVTEAAIAKVATLLAGEDGNENLGLRVAVRPGGCSGFSYEMFFDSAIHSDDTSWTQDDVRFIVDAASAPLLSGATLDYLDTLNKTGFKIENPNAQRSCGCGQSFS